MCCFAICTDATFTDGFYAAVSVGANWGHANWSGLASISLVDDNQDPNAFFKSWAWTPSGETSIDAGKLLGNIAFGYQLVDGRLYLGGQISYTLRGKQVFYLKDMHTFEQTSPVGLFPRSMLSGTSQILSKMT